MVTIWLPSMVRDLTGGQRQVRAEGGSVAEVIDALEASFPGMRGRLCTGDRLKPMLAVAIDGKASKLGLRARLRADSEVRFLPAIAGG